MQRGWLISLIIFLLGLVILFIVLSFFISTFISAPIAALCFILLIYFLYVGYRDRAIYGYPSGPVIVEGGPEF